GYGGVALAAALSGWLAADFVARDVLVVGGAAIAVAALLVSLLFVRDTGSHVALEQTRHDPIRRRTSRACAMPSPMPPTADRPFAPARRRAWSTISMTR